MRASETLRARSCGGQWWWQNDDLDWFRCIASDAHSFDASFFLFMIYERKIIRPICVIVKPTLASHRPRDIDLVINEQERYSLWFHWWPHDFGDLSLFLLSSLSTEASLENRFLVTSKKYVQEKCGAELALVTSFIPNDQFRTRGNLGNASLRFYLCIFSECFLGNAWFTRADWLTL